MAPPVIGFYSEFLVFIPESRLGEIIYLFIHKIYIGKLAGGSAFLASILGVVGASTTVDGK